VALARLARLGRALTADGEDAVLDLDGHIVLGGARQVGLDDVPVVGFDDVDRRDPAARTAGGAGGRVSKKVLKRRFISVCSGDRPPFGA
jgi:hypothetical protein